MITLNGINFELPLVANNPHFGYVDEFSETEVISGKIIRDFKGKRFNAQINYNYLTEAQVADIYALLDAQKTTGYISASVTMPGGTTYNGNVFLSVVNSQARFCIKDGVAMWTNWQIILKGVELI